MRVMSARRSLLVLIPLLALPVGLAGAPDPTFLETVLPWLPSDTESRLVSRLPFSITSETTSPEPMGPTGYAELAASTLTAAMQKPPRELHVEAAIRAGRVLVQREMESRRSPLASVTPFSAGQWAEHPPDEVATGELGGG